MAKPKVFVDSSVLIAATLSVSGGSSRLLTGMGQFFDFVINDYVLGESLMVLTHKFQDSAHLKSHLLSLLGAGEVAVLKNPSAKLVKSTARIIDLTDAPILAGALDDCNYLVTLDNDFFSPDVLTYRGLRNLKIVKPKELIAAAPLP